MFSFHHYEILETPSRRDRPWKRRNRAYRHRGRREL